MKLFDLFKQSKCVTVQRQSNIVQSDEMGYPLLLCLMSDGTQQWIDVDLEWAKKGLKNGKLKLLEWK